MSNYTPRTSNKGSRRKKLEMRNSPELAYLYGIVIGDGNVSPIYNKPRKYQTHIIQLVSKDYIFCKEFTDVANLVLNTNFAGPKKRKDGYWRAFVASNALADWIYSNDWIETIKEHPIEFLRGYYESEGSSYKGVISIAATNQSHIKLAEHALTQLGFKYFKSVKKITSTWSKKNEIYVLRIYKKDERERFICTINPIIKHEVK